MCYIINLLPLSRLFGFETVSGDLIQAAGRLLCWAFVGPGDVTWRGRVGQLNYPWRDGGKVGGDNRKGNSI